MSMQIPAFITVFDASTCARLHCAHFIGVHVELLQSPQPIHPRALKHSQLLERVSVVLQRSAAKVYQVRASPCLLRVVPVDVPNWATRYLLQQLLFPMTLCAIFHVRFVWGRSRLPKGEWPCNNDGRRLQFQIVPKNGGDDSLPLAHACFFQVRAVQ
jgi:hypothetical protein